MSHLPDPTELGLPPFPGTVVALSVPADGLVVFRLVSAVPATEDDFVPRTTMLKVGGQSVLLTCAISVFLSSESALRVRRRPASRLAQLRLEPDPLMHVARTNRLLGGDHVSVWAPKRRLLRAVIRYR
jgi:hypothetical protein